MTQDKKTLKVFYILGIIPVIWFSLIIAPITKGGLVNIITNFVIIRINK